jgi:hypothetical protein
VAADTAVGALATESAVAPDLAPEKP